MIDLVLAVTLCMFIVGILGWMGYHEGKKHQ